MIAILCQVIIEWYSQSRLYSYVSRMHRDQVVGSDPNAF